MPEVSFDNLLIVFLIAVSVPVLLGLGPRWRVPSVVVEIIAGVVVGPSVLGWVQIDLPVQILAIFGLAFLLFLAGVEIDLRQLRGRLLQVAPAPIQCGRGHRGHQTRGHPDLAGGPIVARNETEQQQGCGRCRLTM